MATAPENKNDSDQEEFRSIEVIPEPEPIEDLNVISFKREDTRGKLASYFLIGFFIILFSGLVISAFSEGDKTSNATSLMLTISGILSGPLGFVIGYYFRSTENEN